MSASACFMFEFKLHSNPWSKLGVESQARRELMAFLLCFVCLLHFLSDVQQEAQILGVGLLTGDPWMPIPGGPISPGAPCTPGSPLSPCERYKAFHHNSSENVNYHIVFKKIFIETEIMYFAYLWPPWTWVSRNTSGTLKETQNKTRKNQEKTKLCFEIQDTRWI